MSGRNLSYERLSKDFADSDAIANSLVFFLEIKEFDGQSNFTLIDEGKKLSKH